MPLILYLVEQFSKYANLFFLFTALIQQIPGVSPTNPYTTIAPLAVVLLASAFKETQEDLVSALIRLASSLPLARASVPLRHPLSLPRIQT